MPLSFTGPDSFYSVDENAWWESVDLALKGRSRQTLFGSTEDGLEITPIYSRRSDVPARELRTGAQNWTLMQRVEIPDPVAANAQIIEDLQGGADGFELVFAGAGTSDGHGIHASDLADFEALFDGVLLDLVKIRVNAGAGTPEAVALLLAFLDQRGIALADVEIASGFDPFAWLASRAPGSFELQSALRQAADLLHATEKSGVSLRTLNADGQAWHNAGATPAQELGLVLASATAQLRMLEDTGLKPETWSGLMSLALVADADQFGTIAKARAMRALWACVLDGAGLPQSQTKLHMSSSFRMLTGRDPWVNLLRNTVAVFAAGIGGADSICALPHTFAVGLPDQLARRLARNTQAILLEESNLARVKDPAAGSGAIEDRTEKLCGAAWSFFQTIEAAGGLADALDQGLVQKQIATSRDELDKNVARRKRPITGVSEFPNLSEKPVSVMSTSQTPSKAKTDAPRSSLPEPGTGEWTAAVKDVALKGFALSAIVKLPDSDSSELDTARLAEPFEQLRAAAEHVAEKTSKPPLVFLATLGSLAQYTARATWIANAFAAGGIDAVAPAVYPTFDALLEAFKESAATIACLVSSDSVYESDATDAAARLKAAGVQYLYLAGRPGEREADLKDNGVDAFVYAGCDLLEILKDAHTRLAGSENFDNQALEVPS
ncbi:methylmalonyl-CoA mutase family protein [uncultured Roseibium sp.]|uniref:methylmalonyl-CoA mutase family protein n=1 Tax=uncultured Roseibium sp. TaxID=1936171 RepID=UPI002633AB31|nr:methylmalonyl-CoA mutase family protein [uncultured Roseibium sp.]